MCWRCRSAPLSIFRISSPSSTMCSRCSMASGFDLGLYGAGCDTRRGIHEVGRLLRVLRNIHPDMSAIVVVVDSPYYAASTSVGSITIADVPPGRYRLSLWHERFKPENAAEYPKEVVISSANSSLGTIRMVEARRRPHHTPTSSATTTCRHRPAAPSATTTARRRTPQRVCAQRSTRASTLPREQHRRVGRTRRATTRSFPATRRASDVTARSTPTAIRSTNRHHRRRSHFRFRRPNRRSRHRCRCRNCWTTNCSTNSDHRPR